MILTDPLKVRLLRRFVLASGVLFPSAGYTGLSVFVAHKLTHPTPHAARIDPRIVNREVEPWSIRTDDGLTLRGWYCPSSSETRRLIVCVHGMQMNWAELAGVGRDLNRLGYDVLLFDLRGHGESDPSRLSMGRFERRDLRAVLRWAVENEYTPDRIGWIGSSMGAATLLMEGATNPDIRAAVLDSPFGDLPELLGRELAEHSGLPRLFNPGILLAARLAFGVRTDDLIPMAFAHRWKGRPLLLIHGGDDEMVPARHSLQIAERAGADCTPLIVPGSHHANAYRDHPRWYIGQVDRFFRSHLGPRDEADTALITRTAKKPPQESASPVE